MEKLNLTYINRTERVSTKTNKPFTSVSLKCTQHGERYLSGFGDKTNADWKDGDVVEVARVYESDKKDKDGKPYLNFEMPKFNIADAFKRIETLENAMSLVKLKLKEHEDKLNPPKVTGTEIPYPEPESDEIPFED